MTNPNRLTYKEYCELVKMAYADGKPKGHMRTMLLKMVPYIDNHQLQEITVRQLRLSNRIRVLTNDNGSEGLKQEIKQLCGHNDVLNDNIVGLTRQLDVLNKEKNKEINQAHLKIADLDKEVWRLKQENRRDGQQ